MIELTRFVSISDEAHKKLLEIAEFNRTTVEPTNEKIISDAYDEMMNPLDTVSEPSTATVNIQKRRGRPKKVNKDEQER